MTPRERELAELARRLAAADPDAAQALARFLAAAAEAQKRWRGCGIVLRVNQVEGKIELIKGE